MPTAKRQNASAPTPQRAPMMPPPANNVLSNLPDAPEQALTGFAGATGTRCPRSLSETSIDTGNKAAGNKSSDTSGQPPAKKIALDLNAQQHPNGKSNAASSAGVPGAVKQTAGKPGTLLRRKKKPGSIWEDPYGESNKSHGRDPRRSTAAASVEYQGKPETTVGGELKSLLGQHLSSAKLVPQDLDAQYFENMDAKKLKTVAVNLSIIGGYVFGNLFDINHNGVGWAKADDWKRLRLGKVIWRSIHGELYGDDLGIDSLDRVNGQ